VSPTLQLIRLFWWVYRCLVFTWDWEWIFSKYCDSSR